MSELQQKGLEFAKQIFDDIREMSKDVQGVTRQAFSAKETEVLEYLKKNRRKIEFGNRFGSCRQCLDDFTW